MIIQEYASAEVAAKSRMPGFSLYENTIHNVSMGYPSDWNKQEILLNNDHIVFQVMFALPIAARFSKAEDSETISEKIRDIIYNRSSAVVVLNLKELSIHETATLQAVTNDHIHTLGICFDNITILENSYDHKIGQISYSKLIYTYTDPLQNDLKKERRVASIDATLLASGEKGKVSQIIAKKIGVSTATYERVKKIIEKGTEECLVARLIMSYVILI